MKMRSIWRTKAWRERRRELLRMYPICEWCGNVAQVINHHREGYYPGYELCKREEIDIICNRCHKDWTERKVKNSRAMDECTTCGYPAFKGKSKCFFCGEVVKKHVRHSSEQERRLLTIFRRCPEVIVGDVWKGVWLWSDLEISIKGFKEQDTLPWPLVVTDRGEVGLPAFMFGERLKIASNGLSWRAWKAAQA